MRSCDLLNKNLQKMNELRKEYHNKTAGQIGEKARDLQTSYFTDEYVFWLENELKQLRIASVSTRLKMGAKVYKKDKTITGFIDIKADRGFNHWIVIWNNGEQTKEYGSDLNVC